MAISYLHDPNHLIIQVAPKALMGDNDELFTYGSFQAKFDMTGLELKQAVMGFWSLTGDDQYKLVKVIPGGAEVAVDEALTVQDNGIRNGTPIKIIAA